MIGREEAVRLVAAELEREFPGMRLPAGPSRLHVQISDVERHELCWIVSYQSAEFLRTGDSAYMLVGNGPYLVDRMDGSLHSIGVVDAVTEAWEPEYRTRIRGERLPGAAALLADEVRDAAALTGRVAALRLLRRRVPALDYPQAKAYLAALLHGAAPPPALLALATAALEPVSYLTPTLGIRTLTGPLTPSSPPPDPDPDPATPAAGTEDPRFIGRYRELSSDGSGPSMHDVACLEPRPYEGELAAYLRAGNVLAAASSAWYDELRGDGTLIAAKCIHTDGTWFWRSDLSYYVETYHLAVDERFLAHAAALGWQPPRLSPEELQALSAV
ncbi:YrhB domain-containing protein [Streptomyces sp. NPDC048411]|uniref:YrhB domain-containing protein n=1 Tax=Streptomyces sp. NPDC048411 TaxID=3157206 RepID=UPI0034544D24